MRCVDVTVGDRVVSALSYLSAGWLGIIYCIFLYFAKRRVSNFVRFNVSQSIFFALLYFVVSITLGLIFSILSHIPIIQQIVSWLQIIFLRPVIFQYSLVKALILGLMLYFVIFSLMGEKPYIYKLSKMLDR